MVWCLPCSCSNNKTKNVQRITQKTQSKNCTTKANRRDCRLLRESEMGLFTKTCFNILNFILKFPIYSNKLRDFWTAHVSFLKFCKSLWTKKEIGIKCKFKCVFYSNLFNVPCDFVYNLHGFILNINVCKHLVRRLRTFQNLK